MRAFELNAEGARYFSEKPCQGINRKIVNFLTELTIKQGTKNDFRGKTCLA